MFEFWRSTGTLKLWYFYFMKSVQVSLSPVQIKQCQVIFDFNVFSVKGKPPDLSLCPVLVSALDPVSPPESICAVKPGTLIVCPIERDTTIKHMTETKRHHPPAGPRGPVLQSKIQVLLRLDFSVNTSKHTWTVLVSLWGTRDSGSLLGFLDVAPHTWARWGCCCEKVSGLKMSSQRVIWSWTIDWTVWGSAAGHFCVALIQPEILDPVP